MRSREFSKLSHTFRLDLLRLSSPSSMFLAVRLDSAWMNPGHHGGEKGNIYRQNVVVIKGRAGLMARRSP